MLIASNFLIDFGFKNSLADTSLFVLNDGHHTIYLFVYVDDLIITRDKQDRVTEFISILANKFSLKILVNYLIFWGLKLFQMTKGDSNAKNVHIGIAFKVEYIGG